MILKFNLLFLPATLALVENNEYFSSISHIQTLQMLENQVIESFDEILDKEAQRLNHLKSFLNEVKSKNPPTAESEDFSSLTHPISQYQLIRRMNSDWPNLIKINQAEYQKYPNNLIDEFEAKFQEITVDFELPKATDLKGSAEAIVRLQDTYSIKTSDFADGTLARNNISEVDLKNLSKFSTEDCMQIAMTAYKNEDDYHALLWARQAYILFSAGDTINSDAGPISEIEILDYVSYSFNMLYYRHFALDVMEILLKKIDEIDQEFGKENGLQIIEEYNRKRFAANKEFYLDQIEKNQYINVRYEDDWLTFEVPKPDTGYNVGWFENYEKLCAQENFYDSISQEKQDDLFCFYHTQNNNPRLILRPIKAELVEKVPSKVIFHDFLSEEELSFIKNTARPLLQRATVHNLQTGKLEHAKYRVQKSTWLDKNNYRYEFLGKIEQRIEDATGITQETAELFQVANYGIGGQYEPHFDHSKRPDAHKGDGTRIATLLMYLTDVEMGGHTGVWGRSRKILTLQ